MPSFVINEKCDGCVGKDKTACMYLCPNDLLFLEPIHLISRNRAPDLCWDCGSCAAACPRQAIALVSLEDALGPMAPIRKITLLARPG